MLSGARLLSMKPNFRDRLQGANATGGTVNKPAFARISTGLREYQMSDSHD